MRSAITRFTARFRSSRRLQLGAGVLLVLLLFGLWCLMTPVLDPYGGRIVDNITIDGVNVGGMTRMQARKALRTAAEETILSQPLTVVLPEETLILEPEAIGLKLDSRKAVKAVYSLGRRDDSAAAVENSLTPYLTYDRDAVKQRLLEYAAAHDTVLTQPQVRLEGAVPVLTEDGYDANVPCPVLLLTLGTPESHLDVEAVLAAIEDTFDRGISAGKAGTYQLRISVDPEQLPDAPDLSALYAAYAREAADAFADLETYQIVPGSYGMVFDQEAAQSAAASASWGETIAIPMVYREPEILSENVLFRDVLGSCETRHTDDENRNTNLRLVCQILDGLILEPGEEFSYNGVIGERTEERGFKPAGAYSGTRLVKDIGGGVCQGSSTLYNCVLLADLEVTERVCHGLLVNYLPIGLDAAVNWATQTDFKFRNNFHFPIMLQAELSDGYMKMKILGTDEKDYYVEMRSGRSDEELRIYSNSYKYKYDKQTGELISKELEARSSYMYFTS